MDYELRTMDLQPPPSYAQFGPGRVPYRYGLVVRSAAPSEACFHPLPISFCSPPARPKGTLTRMNTVRTTQYTRRGAPPLNHVVVALCWFRSTK